MDRGDDPAKGRAQRGVGQRRFCVGDAETCLLHPSLGGPDLSGSRTLLQTGQRGPGLGDPGLGLGHLGLRWFPQQQRQLRFPCIAPGRRSADIRLSGVDHVRIRPGQQRFQFRPRALHLRPRVQQRIMGVYVGKNRVSILGLQQRQLCRRHIRPGGGNLSLGHALPRLAKLPGRRPDAGLGGPQVGFGAGHLLRLGTGQQRRQLGLGAGQCCLGCGDFRLRRRRLQRQQVRLLCCQLLARAGQRQGQRLCLQLNHRFARRYPVAHAHEYLRHSPRRLDRQGYRPPR